MKRFVFVVVFMLQLPLFLSAQQIPIHNESLASRLDTLIAQRLPVGSNVAICIYDLTAEQNLYTYQADKLSRPASVMKLLTAITALSRPEADLPFTTEVWYTGGIERDTLRGDLYVVGGFDPEFDETALDSLANLVAHLPFSVIQGKVYGDISMKDSLYWGSGWSWDDTPDSFQPYLSPLMLSKGVVTVHATPAARGKAADLKLLPHSTYYTLINKTSSYTPAAGPFRVSRNWLENGNEIVVTGNVDRKCVGLVNMYASQDFFMRTWVDRLQEHALRIPSDYEFKEFLNGDKAVRVGVYTTPMRTVLKNMLKESDNLNAEAMLCSLGQQVTGKKKVSADEGLSAIRELIKQLGYNPAHYNLADGCGLSNYNYISPELLVAFLKFAYAHPSIFQQLYAALPIGGVDGTLKNRMKSGTASYRNVHAKTGSVKAISCLAGYLQRRDKHQIAFAIMNQNVLSGKEARTFQDAVCDLIVSSTDEIDAAPAD